MSAHITPRKTYVAIFAALMVLTAITVAVATIDLGFLNNVVMLAVAGAKATLVVLFFMEVRHAHALTKLSVVAGFVWLVILLLLLMSDYISRAWLPLPQGW